MMNLRFSLHEGTLVQWSAFGRAAALSAMLAFGFFAGPGIAADDEEDEEGSMSIIPAPPAWTDGIGSTVRFVGIDGSSSKFREDHNIQTGIDLWGSGSDDSGEGTMFSFDGLYQPVDGQADQDRRRAPCAPPPDPRPLGGAARARLAVRRRHAYRDGHLHGGYRGGL